VKTLNIIDKLFLQHFRQANDENHFNRQAAAKAGTRRSFYNW